MTTKDERAERDQKILQLFLAGASYRQIAAAVGLKSAGAVHGIVKRELESSGDRREVLTDSALAVFQERTEALFRAHWGAALRGDHRSAEVCRRILDQQSRILLTDTAPARVPVTESADTVEDSTFDELSRRRAGRRAVPAGRKRPTGND